ncbi:conserved hypothetical protein [Burkholderia sp. 8Y]|uniref:hypothetical protein n=1 Tax=Burkholderia sp. 8Y TaxID=2653133 RepID=UPI0012F0F906|nr:hypothetical protein [Burkholderia sp. 8Y]VXB14736.1 conserved hypothetical protein [Burkholderia sp. 8Y]
MNRRDTHAIHGRSRRLVRAVLRVLFALIGMAAMLAADAARAQQPDWLDPHVTQATIVDTICVPGYVDRVLPSFQTQMRQKERLLKQRSIDASFASEYALDHRMPVLLGGSPNAPANLDVRRWEGRNGQRRKERLAVYLKRCVCTGDMTLRAAQSAMAGDWPNLYPNLSSMSCQGY